MWATRWVALPGAPDLRKAVVPSMRVSDERVDIFRMNPVTLSFSDPKEERSFLQAHAVGGLRIVRVSLLFAAALYIAFSLLDHQLRPERADSLLAIRIPGTIFLLAVVALSTLRSAPKYFQLTMAAVVVIGGTGVVAIVTIAETTGWTSYYGGVILALIYAHALLRLRFIYATLSSWAIVGMYFLSMEVIATLPPSVILNNTVYVVSANLLGMFSSYGLEYYARTVYHNTRMLDASQKQLSVEYERTTNELAAVREIQLSMLPRELPEHSAIDLSVTMTTATEVGGDYYDFVTADDGKLTFAIGDATGHGVRAGALVTASKLLFTTYAVRDDPASFLQRTSHALRGMNFPKLYMTMAVGKICEMELEIAGAGMPPALLYRAATATVAHVTLKGIPLGSGFNGHYTSKRFPLGPGDVLVFMSDGLPEMFNAGNAMLGYEPVESELMSTASRPAPEILERITRRAEEWRAHSPLRDDVTVMVMKMKGSDAHRVKEGSGYARSDYELSRV